MSDWAPLVGIKIGDYQGEKQSGGADASPWACAQACKEKGYAAANHLIGQAPPGPGCYCVPDASREAGGGLTSNWSLVPCSGSKDPSKDCNGVAFVPLGDVPQRSSGLPSYTECKAQTVDNEYLHLVDPDKSPPEVLQNKASCAAFCDNVGSPGFVWDEGHVGTKCIGCIAAHWADSGQYDKARAACLQPAPTQPYAERQPCPGRATYLKDGATSVTCDTKCVPKPSYGWCACDCAFRGAPHVQNAWTCANKRDNYCTAPGQQTCAPAQVETETAHGSNGCWAEGADATSGEDYANSMCQCTCADGSGLITDACPEMGKPQPGGNPKGCLVKSYYPKDTCITQGS